MSVLCNFIEDDERFDHVIYFNKYGRKMQNHTQSEAYTLA